MDSLETHEENIACIRAIMERFLLAMYPGVYKDYQMEKWGRIIKTKQPEEDLDRDNHMTD